MNIMKKIFFILFFIALFTGCERKINEFSPSANGVDFSKFVAVGNSMVGGFSDAALYLSGQQNSIPNIMATQFQTVGGGSFIQLLSVTKNGIGFSFTPGGLIYNTKMK